MRRFSVLIAAALLSACSHAPTPQIAPGSRPIVPLILQTGTPPLHWDHITIGPSDVSGLGRAPSGNEWFTWGYSISGTATVGYVSMNRSITAWPTDGTPSSIVAGPGGNMWFTVAVTGGSESIESISPTGNITHYPNVGEAHIVLCNGPDGNLWSTLGPYSNGVLEKFPPSPQAVPTQFDFGSNVTYGQCRKGADGRIWFGSYIYLTNVSQIGAFDPVTSTASFYPTPAMVRSLTVGPDGNLWIGMGPPAEYPPMTGSIGKVTPTGSVSVYPLPTGENASGGIVSGPDGNIWYASSGGIVGEITTAGTVVGVHLDPYLARGQSVKLLSAGVDGNLWVGTNSPGQIDVFIPNPLTASPSPVVLAAGTSTTLTISKRHYSSSFTVTSADPNIATVINAGTRTTFTVTGVAHGTTTLTIDDKYQNSLVVGVTVN